MLNLIISNRLKTHLITEHQIDYGLYLEETYTRQDCLIQSISHQKLLKKADDKFVNLNNLVYCSQEKIDKVLTSDFKYKDEVKKLAYLLRFEKECPIVLFEKRTINLIIVRPYRKLYLFKTKAQVYRSVSVEQWDTSNLSEKEARSKKSFITYNNFYSYCKFLIERYDVMIGENELREMSFEKFIEFMNDLKVIHEMMKY